MTRHTDTGRRIRLLALIGMLVFTLAALPLSAQGTTLLSDDFQDGNATGWSTAGGSWSVVSDGTLAYRQSSTSGNATALVGSTGWTNQSVQARVKAISFVGSSEFVAVLARVQSSTSYYYLSLRNANKIEIKKLASGSATLLASASFTVNTGVWYTLRLEAQDSTLRGFVNGAQVLSASDSQFTSGRAGLATYNGSASFDDVLVTGAGGSLTPTPVTPTAGTATPLTPTPLTPTPVTPTVPSGGIHFGLVGYGAGTTGGAGGSTVTVNSLNALKTAAANSAPLIIQVNGTITGSGSDSVAISSNKTIIGVGSAGKLIGVELNISDGVSNVIIRNLSISKVVAPRDSIHIQGPNVHHIWIDHNELSSDTSHDKDYYDGALDMSHDVDNVTISWNVFRDHYKTSLIGHSDNNASEDSGSFRVTYHHNYFYNVSSRTPSIRFGTLHSYNNLFESFIDASSGISSRMGACARIENNVFSGVLQPVLTTQSGTGSKAGGVQLIGNNFGGGTIESSPGCTLTPPYSYSAESVSTVPTTVKANAGVGKIN